MSLRCGRIALSAAAILVMSSCGGKSPVQPTPTPTACTFALSTASLSFGASAATGTVTVTTAASCAWTAASDRGWLTIASGAAGTGPGPVSVALTANTGADARSATLTVAGQPVAVRQEGAPACTIAVSPASATFTKDAATGTFTVTSPDSCAWSLASNADWLTITTGATASGTSAIGYAVARNGGPASRTGTISAGSAVFTVTQAGDGGTCTYQVSPVRVNACMPATSSLVVDVVTENACTWTAASDASWISLSGGASRSGPGQLRFGITENYDAPRLGVIKLRWDTPTAGQNVQVAQAGCRYAVSPSSVNAPADGGAFSVDVFQESDPNECGGPLQNGCVWTATGDAPWITITTPMPRSGDERVSFTVASTPGPARVGHIMVRDKVVSVLQAAR